LKNEQAFYNPEVSGRDYTSVKAACQTQVQIYSTVKDTRQGERWERDWGNKRGIHQK